MTHHTAKEKTSTPEKSNIKYRENYSTCHGVFTHKKASLKDSRLIYPIPSHSPSREATVPNPSGMTLLILIVVILIVMKY